MLIPIVAKNCNTNLRNLDTKWFTDSMEAVETVPDFSIFAHYCPNLQMLKISQWESSNLKNSFLDEILEIALKCTQLHTLWLRMNKFTLPSKFLSL